MCGRYQLLRPERLVDRWWIDEQFRVPLPPNGNVSPGQRVPVVLADHRLELVRWGMTPTWARSGKRASLLINARAETVAEKPTFRRLLREGRCLLPASGFYEWHAASGGKKVPYLFARPDGALFGFAGLYDTRRDADGRDADGRDADGRDADGQEAWTCLILTTAPNATVASVHDRMPVILRPEEEADWLNPDLIEAADLLPLLRTAPEEELVASRADPATLKRG